MPKKKGFRALLLAVDTALGIALPLLAGIFLGLYLDKRFLVKPLFLIAGILLGLLTAFNYVYRLLLRHNRP
jgi:F0F1-type ATP synthase assembly protein I